MSCIAQKVTALIVRDTPAGRQLLLFRHPSAGVQIPAGTMEEGETPAEAALREGREESGLANLALVRWLGTNEFVLPPGEALIGRETTVYSRPDVRSWDWAHLQRGLRVFELRSQGEWVQIDFRENNRFPDPEYFTYQVIGWVPAHVLCHGVRRHFYLLTPTEDTLGAEWAVEIDYHIFRPFWMSLDEVLASGGDIVEPQRAWLDYLRDIRDETPLQPGPGVPLS